MRESKILSRSSKALRSVFCSKSCTSSFRLVSLPDFVGRSNSIGKGFTLEGPLEAISCRRMGIECAVFLPTLKYNQRLNGRIGVRDAPVCRCCGHCYFLASRLVGRFCASFCAIHTIQIPYIFISSSLSVFPILHPNYYVASSFFRWKRFWNCSRVGVRSFG